MRVNNGLTPQELEAYGISDVHDIDRKSVV